ncbi:hypothetical protein LCGC14_2808570, partial [marine sediment metagenome]
MPQSGHLPILLACNSSQFTSSQFTSSQFTSSQFTSSQVTEDFGKEAEACWQNHLWQQSQAAENTTGSTWHPAGESSSAGADAASTPTKAPALVADVASRPITQIANDSVTLPNDHGQVWREYDISPYTIRVTSTKRPEQAIIDWILQETGYEAWHSEPLGVLSADSRTLRVYHTPETQAVVADLVARFVDSEAETTTFSLRVTTVGHPSWRAKAQRMLRPVSVQTPGVSAWLLAKEDAAML